MEFPAAVERWRPVVAKYFPANLVDKALYVIQHESKGDPTAVGDGGAARGLFQIQDKRNFPQRPDAAFLDNPENNIKYAAQQLGAAAGKWSDWGEGTEGQPAYDPKTGKGRFGALGNNPFGSAGQQSAPTGGKPMSMTDAEYFAARRKYAELFGKFSPYFAPDGSPTALGAATINSYQASQQSGGRTPYTGPNLDMAEIQSYLQLGQELEDYEYDHKNVGTDQDSVRQWYDFQNKNDPRAIDAANAAEQYTREYNLRTEAGAQAQEALQTQLATANAATKGAQDLSSFATSGAAQPGFRVAMPGKILSGDDMFSQTYERLKKNLPAFVPKPYANMPTEPTPSSTTGTVQPSYGIQPGSPEDDAARLAQPAPTAFDNSAAEGALAVTGASPVRPPGATPGLSVADQPTYNASGTTSTSQITGALFADPTDPLGRRKKSRERDLARQPMMTPSTRGLTSALRF